MPTIVTRGVASARGAGTFSAAPPPLPPPPPSPTPPPPPPPPGPVLQTVTFFNNGGSWTAPAGVTNLTSLYVVGGTDGMTAAQYVRTGNSYLLVQDNPAQPGSPLTAFTFAEANTYVNNFIANANSGGTGDRSISYLILTNNYNSNTGGFFNIFNQVGPIQIRGEVVLQSGPAFNQTNEIVYPFQNWFIAHDQYFPPEFVAGGPSSAFGYTAQGGAPPQEISQANVPVVPGQTYNIQVSPSSGLVQFQFIQG